MVVEAFCFVIGVTTGLVAVTVCQASQLEKPTRKGGKPVVHMRGHTPAWFKNAYCQADYCFAGEVEDKPGHFYKRNAAYVDQDGHYWCEKHLPKATKIAERMCTDPNEQGVCVIHDYPCPKPWAPY